MDIDRELKLLNIKIYDIDTDDPRNLNYLLMVYTEIKNRLMTYSRYNSTLYKQIDDAFDIKLFQQMIEYKVFNRDSFEKLVNTVFFWLKQLSAPIRDNEIDKTKENILNAETHIIEIFIIKTFTYLDILDCDIKQHYMNRTLQ